MPSARRGQLVGGSGGRVTEAYWGAEIFNFWPG